MKRRPTGLGVEGGGLFVGGRGDQGELVLLGELDRLVEVDAPPSRCVHAPVPTFPGSGHTGPRSWPVRPPPTCGADASARRTDFVVERSFGAAWILLRVSVR